MLLRINYSKWNGYKENIDAINKWVIVYQSMQAWRNPIFLAALNEEFFQKISIAYAPIGIDAWNVYK